MLPEYFSLTADLAIFILIGHNGLPQTHTKYRSCFKLNRISPKIKHSDSRMRRELLLLKNAIRDIPITQNTRKALPVMRDTSAKSR